MTNIGVKRICTKCIKITYSKPLLKICLTHKMCYRPYVRQCNSPSSYFLSLQENIGKGEYHICIFRFDYFANHLEVLMLGKKLITGDHEYNVKTAFLFQTFLIQGKY